MKNNQIKILPTQKNTSQIPTYLTRKFLFSKVTVTATICLASFVSSFLSSDLPKSISENRFLRLSLKYKSNFRIFSDSFVALAVLQP